MLTRCSAFSRPPLPGIWALPMATELDEPDRVPSRAPGWWRTSWSASAASAAQDLGVVLVSQPERLLDDSESVATAVLSLEDAGGRSYLAMAFGQPWHE